MQLSCVVTRNDVVQLLEQLTPFRVDLGGRRAVTFARPRRVELVPEVGVRVEGEARVTWDVGIVTLPVTVESWSMVLVASVASRGDAWHLRFDPVVEDLVLRGAPAFVDGKIAELINESLGAAKRKLSWNFSKTLSVKLRMPRAFDPPARFDLRPGRGEIVVDRDEVRLTATFVAEIVRAGPEDRRPAPGERAGDDALAARRV